MPNSSWVYDGERKTLVPKTEFLARRAIEASKKRSTLAFPAFVGGMEPIKSMADGKIYSDRRTYEKSLARHGCEVVGFDKNWTDHVKPAFDARAHEAAVVSDVKQAVQEVSNRT